MSTTKNDPLQSWGDNFKRSATELVVLSLLNEEDMYGGQILAALKERSQGVFDIVFPYAVFYRMIDLGYIVEAYKKIAPDGRRRQYYRLTDKGRAYLQSLIPAYRQINAAIERILSTGKA